jgi:hypothetical protein
LERILLLTASDQESLAGLSPPRMHVPVDGSDFIEKG